MDLILLSLLAIAWFITFYVCITGAQYKKYTDLSGKLYGVIVIAFTAFVVAAFVALILFILFAQEVDSHAGLWDHYVGSIVVVKDDGKSFVLNGGQYYVKFIWPFVSKHFEYKEFSDGFTMHANYNLSGGRSMDGYNMNCYVQFRIENMKESGQINPQDVLRWYRNYGWDANYVIAHKLYNDALLKYMSTRTAENLVRNGMYDTHVPFEDNYQVICLVKFTYKNDDLQKDLEQRIYDQWIHDVPSYDTKNRYGIYT